MRYKTILVHLDASERCGARLQYAISLARGFDAHLVSLAVTPPLVIPGSPNVEIVVRMLTEQWERDKARLDEVAATFTERARVAGVSSAEVRVVVGEPEPVFCLHARYADLLLVGQAGADEDSVVPAGFAGRVVLGAGRPVLVVPYAGSPATLGSRVLVAWNATRESTRALTDALALLQQASQVDVMTVNARPGQSGHGELPGADIALYLARHGVRANVHPTYSEDVEVGEWLLSRAADLGSDLIVMGAYGHSRFRELVLGGATRSILQSMTVPVLMSH